MAYKSKMEDGNGETIYPITIAEAVLDSDGIPYKESLESKLTSKNIDDEIDFNTIKKTGVYHIKSSDITNNPEGSSTGTLCVDFDSGIPFQIYICDVDNKIFKRSYDKTNVTWAKWFLFGDDKVGIDKVTDSLDNNMDGWVASSKSVYLLNNKLKDLQPGSVLTKVITSDTVVSVPAWSSSNPMNSKVDIKLKHNIDLTKYTIISVLPIESFWYAIPYVYKVSDTDIMVSVLSLYANSAAVDYLTVQVSYIPK